MNRVGLGRGSLLLLLALGCSGKLNIGHGSTGGGSGGPGNTGGSIWDGGGPSDTGGVLAGGGTGGTTTPVGGNAGNCTPGEVAIEAQGTPAEASIKTLDRCSEGYSCNSAKKCVPIQACAGHLTGDCLVYETPGIAGRSGVPVFNGTGGTSFGNDVAGERSPVTSFAQDASHVYFTTYGSRDRLGNFQDDGALRAVSLEDGALATVVTGLPGAVAVGVTDSHAYLLVDGAPLIGSTTHLRLLRVPLAGGTLEVVQDSPEMPRTLTFVAAGERAFWSSNDGIFVMTPTDAMARTFIPGPAGELSWWMGPLAEDGSNLYYRSSLPGSQDSWIARMALDGGAEQVLFVARSPFAVHGDFAYGAESIENGTGLLLDRVATSGGTWQRVRALGGGNTLYRLQIVGDRFFVDSNPPEVGPYTQSDSSKLSVLTGLLSSDAPPVRVLERISRRGVVDQLWAGTANTFFWSDGNNVYSRSLDAEP